MKAWLPTALLSAARTLVPAFDSTEVCGKALGVLLGHSVLHISMHDALSCVGLQERSELQHIRMGQAGNLLFNATTSHSNQPQPAICRSETALMMCQLVEKLFRQKNSWHLAAQVAYGVPAFLTVTSRSGPILTNSWKQHVQLLWMLFCDSAYSKGVLTCTTEDRLREQADIAVAHCLLSICKEGQQSLGFQLSHGEDVSGSIACS